MRPLQHAIYKGTGGKFGAMQLNLQEPHFYEVNSKKRDYTGEQALDAIGKIKEGWRMREGAIFLEMSSAKGKNVYDWENKIVMALSVTDMGKLSLALLTGDGCSIMHDPGAKTESQGAVTKALKVISPKGTKEGAFATLSKTAGGQTVKHSVPLTGDEVVVLGQLLRSAITKSLNW